MFVKQSVYPEEAVASAAKTHAGKVGSGVLPESSAARQAPAHISAVKKPSLLKGKTTTN
jgi:hypothetical protein